MAREGYHLVGRNISSIRTWPQFLKRWSAVTTAQELKGLLHGAFELRDVAEYAPNGDQYFKLDFLRFYFQVADGWLDERLLTMSEEVTIGPTPEVVKLRKMVAQKAYSLLCQYFFGKSREKRGGADFLAKWEGEFLIYGTLEEVMGFFRVMPKGSGWRVSNLKPAHFGPYSHEDQNIFQFLKDLAAFLWAPHTQQASPELIARAQVWMIQVLAHTGQLYLLEGRLEVLSTDCVNALKEIAMETIIESRHLGKVSGEGRRAANPKQALVADSQAARILLLREAILEGRASLEQS